MAQNTYIKEQVLHASVSQGVCEHLGTQQCMLVQALKERLVERANIIQARHDSETAALVKRQVCCLQQIVT